MADSLMTIAKLIGDAFDLADIEVSDLLKASPLLGLLPMEESSNGTTHKYTKQTGAPVVGFRDANAGRDLSSSTDTLVSSDLEILDFSWEVDQAVAGAWRRGTDAFIAREGARHLQAALMAFEKQLINGVIGASDSAGASGSAAGFSGFRDAGTVNAVADTMVVNAAGTTVDTASSVWAVRLAVDGVAGVFKGDGDPISLGERVAQKRIVNPGTDNATLPTWYTPAWTWLSLQVGSAYDIGRIANLTGDTGKGLTDLLLSQLLEKFPVGFGPTLLVMSRRSRGQLQRSRTTYSPTGQPAPLPSEYEGIPIIASDAVVNTEELIA